MMLKPTRPPPPPPIPMPMWFTTPLYGHVGRSDQVLAGSAFSLTTVLYQR
jgi:hypothetical protein